MSANPFESSLPAPQSLSAAAGEIAKRPLDTLPRVLGPFDAMTVVVGGIIGSGIFLKPAYVAGQLHHFGLIIGVWIVMGLITLCGCLALAELAAMLPHAGGPYVYLREAYGRLPAFLWGWTEFWVIRTGSVGALASATAIYLAELAPMTRGQQQAVAIGIVAALSAISILGTHWSAHLQNLTTIIKVGFLLFLIVLPFALRQEHAEYLRPLFPEQVSWSLWPAIGTAMIAVLWPYDGWINIAPVAEEIRDPQRNVPLALALGIMIVIALYVLANLAYHVSLPMDQVAGSDKVAATMCNSLMGDMGGKFFALGVLCSTFGATNSNLLTGPRIFFAMARDGLLPSSIRRIHGRFETPANAIALQAAWSIVLIAAAFKWKDKPGEAFDALTDFVIFGGTIFYALAVGAVFVLRRRRPDLHRPYRTWGYPFTPAVFLAMYSAVMVSLLTEKWVQSFSGSLLIGAGVLFYQFAKRRTSWSAAAEPPAFE
ncbi:MAG TPA: amino acid permease [Pirellulales bacterium]|nr:amino acid permease [Pirellulales bacterium]